MSTLHVSEKTNQGMLRDLLPALTDGASRPGEAAHAAARPGS